MYVHCGEETNIRDLRSYEHYRNEVEIRSEKIKARTGVELMTSAIPVQRFTNWAKKPIGSWSLCFRSIFFLSEKINYLRSSTKRKLRTVIYFKDRVF